MNLRYYVDNKNPRITAIFCPPPTNLVFCSVPIGAYDVNTAGATLEMENPHPYVDVLVDDFDSPIEDTSQAEDAVKLYRR